MNLTDHAIKVLVRVHGDVASKGMTVAELSERMNRGLYPVYPLPASLIHAMTAAGADANLLKVAAIMRLREG